MKHARKRGAISPVSLREVYHLLGEFSAKLLIDPKVSSLYERVTVTARNSDGGSMPIQFRRWGTKLTVNFTIDSSTPDGVTVLDIALTDGSKTIRERFDFWVIKP